MNSICTSAPSHFRRLGMVAFLTLQLAWQPAAQAQNGPLASALVRVSHAGSAQQADGVVEAIRQTSIAAQVNGAIVALPVKAGDAVKRGQTLARIDARAALQEAQASRAQVDAARAALRVAGKDFERQKLLFAKNYISQAQLDQAEAQYQSATAQANAQIAQANSVQTQAGFYTLSAPYDGVLADMPLTIGEMATPGRPLMSLYDPGALRVTASIPQAQLADLSAAKKIMLELPNLPDGKRILDAVKVTVLPAADATTHSVTVRFDLPPGLNVVTPGMFARVQWLANGNARAGLTVAPNGVAPERVFIPQQALFRRAELFAVYVLTRDGRPQLRQVRPGPVNGNEQEILSGLSAGERVALEPLRAALATAQPAAPAKQ